MLTVCIAMGCVPHTVVDRGTFTVRDYKASQIAIDPVKTFPVVSDLEIKSDKVKVTVRTDSAKSMTQLKNMAMIKFLDTTKADVVIEPRYLTKYSGAQATITMVARPASYRNIRQATRKDARLFGALKELKKAKPKPAPVEELPSLMDINKKGLPSLMDIKTTEGTAQ